ncbi:hypothetical protein MTO96_028805 [Rhipicephalus appendiculatus]
MSGFELPPGPSRRTPTDSSPLLPQPMGRLQCSARGEPVPSQPASRPPQQDHVGSSALLAALQEHIAILRQHLEDAEEGLDSCEPEEFEDLEKALFQVSTMISQMEYTADLLEEKQLNLTNELRTLEEENMYLNEALMRERAKRLDETNPSFSGESVMKTPPRFWHICSCPHKKLARLTTPGRASGDMTKPTSASNVPPSSEPSACVKRRNEIAADHPGLMDRESHPTRAKRGRLSQTAMLHSIPPEHIINEKNSSMSSASTASVMASGLESVSVAGQSVMDPEVHPPSPKRGRLSAGTMPSSMPPERIIADGRASTSISTAVIMALGLHKTSVSTAGQDIIDPEMPPPSAKRGRLSPEATPGSIPPERIATVDIPSMSTASKAALTASGFELISAVDQGIIDPGMRPPGVKRGSAAPTPSSMLPDRITTEANASMSSASTASEFESRRPRANSAPKIWPIQRMQIPDEVDVNDIEQIAEALGIRNNAHAWSDLIIMEDLREFFA